MRRSVVVSVALGVVWLLLPSAGDAQPRAHAAAGGCPGSVFVDGTVVNDTRYRMDPSFFDYPFTSVVCNNESPGSVQPGTRGHWMVGDASLGIFPTFGRVTYRFATGDEVQMVGYVYRGALGIEGDAVFCTWARVVSYALDAGCTWHVEGEGERPGELLVFLRVLPSGGVLTKAARAGPAAVGRCLRGSALVGTTTNQTGVPLKLVSVSHGPADGWCRAPLRSQAAHSAGHWKLGGPRSGASARFVYRLPNGDEMDFRAAINPRNGVIDCIPLDRARARRFSCRTVSKGPLNSESPKIDLQVFRIRAP